MKGTAKRKVVTSGRLTGRVRAEPAREQVAHHPAAAAAACPEPAYSLYSTDSEDQVTTLHKGLDCCAALLTGILQAEKAASPSFSKAVPGGVVKSSTSTSLGKKTSKKLPTKTVQKNSQSGQCRPSTTTPRPSARLTAPAAHSGVKLHPSRKKTRTQLQCCTPLSQTLSSAKPPPQCQTSTVTPQPQTTVSPLQPQPSILLSVVQSSSHPGQLSLHQTDGVRHCDTDCDKEEEDEFVPVRDVNTQNTSTDAHRQTHLHNYTMRMANMQLEPGQADEVPQDVDSRSSCMKVKTVQCVLEELKALIAGQGSAAEMLLSHLEQTLFSPQMNDCNSVIETVPDLSSVHSQNSQLHRCVRILKQQLEEKEISDRQPNMKMLSNSEVLTLQEELTTAQSRLQGLQDDLAELRKALRDTQSQLREREAENIAVKTDLETTRSRLVESERVKSELAALAQQRLEEIENLNRILERQDSSDCPTVVDSVSDTELTTKLEHRECPAGSDHITQYLMSLKQLDPAERKRNTAERKTQSETLNSVSQTVKPSETLNTLFIQSHCLDEVPSCGRWPERECGRLMDSTLSHCDVGSVRSDWSVTSGSTFDTRDEAAFRDGLAALDASIASLQKTIQLDLRR